MRRMMTLVVLVWLVAGLLGAPQPAGAAPGNWKTYEDPRYGFSLNYPGNWRVIPRADQPGSYGGVVTFVPGGAARAGDGAPQVVVGLYTIERAPDQSLADWTAEYMRLSSPDAGAVVAERAQPAPALAQRVPGALALRGHAPRTSFQFTNIPRGRTVWFVWTNLAGASARIYEQMSASFSFGAQTPDRLAGAFGPDFRPLRRAPPPPAAAGPGIAAVIQLPSTSWFAPIAPGASFSVLCGSSKHTGTSAYALDIQMGLNTPVYSTHRSWVDFAGWDASGYGNLIRASTDTIYARTYTAYYAHLNSFATSAGRDAASGALIAYSGNTGPSSIHLHFHVRAAQDSVDLRNLRTFDENSNYPSGFANCGTVRR